MRANRGWIGQSPSQSELSTRVARQRADEAYAAAYSTSERSAHTGEQSPICVRSDAWTPLLSRVYARFASAPDLWPLSGRLSAAAISAAAVALHVTVFWFATGISSVS